MLHIPFIRKIINILYNNGIQRTPRALLGTLNIQRRLIGECASTIFDIGAHTGCLAKLYRKRFPKAQIHCFEPYPGSFNILKNRFVRDSLTFCHRIALSDSSGNSTLNVNLSTGANSTLNTDPRGETYWGKGILDTLSRIVIETVTLDKFCFDTGINCIDILKIDVQGTEFDVLKGAKNLLHNHKISLIYLELIICPTYQGQHKLHEYLSFFDSYGYELLDFFNNERKGDQLIQLDAIFLSNSFKKSIGAL